MKTKLLTLTMSTCILTAGSVAALDCDPAFYVGGEVQYNKYSFGSKMDSERRAMRRVDPNGGIFSPKRDNTAAGLFVGSRVNDNFGVEAGYSVGKKTKTTWSHNLLGAGPLRTGQFNMQTKNLYFDVMGYVPVGCDVDLIGSAGFGRLSTKANLTDSSLTATQLTAVNPGRSTKWGPRIGAGAQYKFNENIGARIMAGYQKGNKYMKNATTIKAGLFYQF